MKAKFEILFLEEARNFLADLEEKARTKILYNIDKSRFLLDPELFKKLDGEIWEFRTRYNQLQYRLLAFWDKSTGDGTMVVATHGFVKKTDRVDANEIRKALNLKRKYFTNIL